MSKFFEMFDNLERRPAWAHSKASDPQPVFERQGAYGSQLERAVRHLYLEPLAPAPRVSLFLALQPGTRPRSICAHVSDLLALNKTASVCLVELDPAGPSLREHMGIPAPSGFGLDWRQTVTQVPCSNLWLLTLTSSVHKGGIFSAAVFSEQIEQVRLRFEFVVIDYPSDSGPEVAELARLADGAVLVVDPGTRREAALRSKTQLEVGGVKILGVILMDRSFPVPVMIPRQVQS